MGQSSMNYTTSSLLLTKSTNTYFFLADQLPGHWETLCYTLVIMTSICLGCHSVPRTEITTGLEVVTVLLPVTIEEAGGSMPVTEPSLTVHGPRSSGTTHGILQ
ncbi:uncharacterized protein LOC134270307 [Saccostrea cucullata]|uniref:uncharacterized protein LOC134270307 n=1 Tax=Saccostrea cuccullata TaxID=36930 RepID=UPI002ED15223